jgi:8-oxo-dGTP pyrophosphatase MutT (NUDIX family)
VSGNHEQDVHDAATVILLRDGAQGGFELFLVQRGKDQAFMGGAYVFPGGRLSPADSDPELARWAPVLSPDRAVRRLQEEGIPEAAGLGLFLAAIRETFEEAGVLLARDRSGRVADLSAAGTASRFDAYRADLHDGRLTLAELARREGLLLAPDLLTPCARWVTPAVWPRRFDTRFFLARLPEGQFPTPDRTELTDSRWLRPALALAEHEAGRIVLMPPTLVTVAELAAFSESGPLLAAAAAMRIEPVLPEAFRTAGGFGLSIPARRALAPPGSRLHPPAGEPVRVVLEAGIWRIRK